MQSLLGCQEKSRKSFWQEKTERKSDLGGGLLLLWNNKFDVSIAEYGSGHIDCVVKSDLFGTFRIMHFYGNSDRMMRIDSLSC